MNARARRNRLSVRERPVASGIRAWLRPPRAHGEVIEDRTVSFLELFYDLVFVVLVARIAHTLADDVSWVGVRDFVLVFALIWTAWANGSMYHELHGGEDGRSRSYIFAQMSLLVLLSVYAGHATTDTDDGRGFAVVYTVLLVLIGWQWFDVRRHDAREMRPLATSYIVGVGAVTVIMAVSTFVGANDARLVLWLVALVMSFAVAVIQGPRFGEAMRVTESMAERFGLFVIIVLGEVVVGVADGLAEAAPDFRTIVTGMLALGIGFGLWWNYFDFVGRRIPRPANAPRSIWLYGHLPLVMSVAAAGAGMVSLVEHAADARAPANSAWLIAGATATAATSLAMVAATMAGHVGRRFVPHALLGAAAVSLVLGALRPPPWALALGLNATLLAVWADAFVRHARHALPIAES
ncbi:low temperature requirement protein A [Candidatus Poriferisodalis sp.]|uniref:low temperature requirement protein A n=1 Tax=Candidatus Poriferisodalis sp. TaxID=3101277 RepID=UPI003B01F7B5